MVSFPRGVSLGDVPRDDGAGCGADDEKFPVERHANRVALAGERGDVANHPALARAHVQERGDGFDGRASLRFLPRDERVDARDDGAAVCGESKGRTASDAVDAKRAAKFSGVELPRDEGAFGGAVRGEKLGVTADVELGDWPGVHLERLEQANVSAFALVFGEAPCVRVALVGAHRDGGAVERQRAHGGGGGTLAAGGTTRHLLGNFPDADHLFLGPIADVEDVEARGVVAVGGDEDVLEDGDVLEGAAGRVGDDARALDERDGVEVAVRSGVGTLSRGGCESARWGEGGGARSGRGGCATTGFVDRNAEIWPIEKRWGRAPESLEARGVSDSRERRGKLVLPTTCVTVAPGWYCERARGVSVSAFVRSGRRAGTPRSDRIRREASSAARARDAPAGGSTPSPNAGSHPR